MKLNPYLMGISEGKSSEFLNDTYALEVTATKRDTEKDAAMKARIKQGLKRMGAATEMAAFERARYGAPPSATHGSPLVI
eukprot:scaffold139867_cov31-Prasinocladus_malaysianus.AAC.1